MTFSDIIPAQNQHRQPVLQLAHQDKSACMGLKAPLPLSCWFRSVLSSPLLILMEKLRVCFLFFPSPIRPIQKMSTCQKYTRSIPTPGIISFLIKDRITTPKEKMFGDDTDISFDSGLLCERHWSPPLPRKVPYIHEASKLNRDSQLETETEGLEY